jgi:hypothetical protein
MPDSATVLGSTALMRRVQELQQLAHPASAVNRFCRQVPCSLTPPLTTSAAGTPDLLGRLSDLAFGYRVTPRGLARRAPSAGAMYPIELVWITQVDGRWAFRYFDPRQQGCVDLGRAAEQTAAALRLAPRQHALLPVAVAWRTAQRYGMRGYRYCVLDAGTVLGNVASVVVAAGAYIHLPDSIPHDLIHQELGLTRDELLLGAAVVEGDFADSIPDLEVGAPRESLDTGRLFGTEQVPMLTPTMERIRRLHRASHPSRQHKLNFRAMLGGHSVDQAVENILLRRSARAFDGTELDPSMLAVLDAFLHRVTEATPVPVWRELELRLVARRDGRWQSRWFDQANDRWLTQPIPDPEPTALTDMFGDQPLAAKTPAFMILGMRGEAGTQGDPEVYRQMLLTAGVTCAGAHHLAAQAGCATTIFGGYDDRRVAELANGRFIPLVVQAFGNSSESARDEKNDTVAATWLAKARSGPAIP